MTEKARAQGLETEFEECGDKGFQHSLSNFQMQMIAIGGAVGVGLFLGVGGRIAYAGPGLLISYLVVSVLVYFLMRAVGEMVMYRPSSGSFVSWAHEFVGERFATMTGWTYVILAGMAATAEVCAIAVYVHTWLPDVPSWIPSLVALCIIVASNLVSVRMFGNIEMITAMIKVVAIVAFIALGTFIIIFGGWVDLGARASFSNLMPNGTLFPTGLLPILLAMQGVVFSYSAVEMIGIAAGEAEDARKSIPRAVNGVAFRIAVFYLGSILVLLLLLPFDQYAGSQSPFVTALSSLNIPYLPDIMNFVVITAAISGVNASIYAGGRLLHNLAAHGTAPRFTVGISKRGVPYGSILTYGVFIAAGIVLTAYEGAMAAFETALGACAVLVAFGWVSIFVSHICYRRQVDAGRKPSVNFRMPGWPLTSYLCLAGLGIFWLSMVFDFKTGIVSWGPLIATIAFLGGSLLLHEYCVWRRSTEDLPVLEGELIPAEDS